MSYKKRSGVRVTVTLAILFSQSVLSAFAQSVMATSPHAKHPSLPSNVPSSSSYGSIPLRFEINRGQSTAAVKFIARGMGYTAFLTSDEAVLVLSRSASGSSASSVSQSGKRDKSTARSGTAIVRIKFAGASLVSRGAEGIEPLPGKVNYLVGNDPAKWRTNIPTYAKAQYQGIYPGMDIVFHGSQQQLEFDFVIAPGADPKQIRLSITGDGKLEMHGTDLVLRTRAGSIRLHKPLIYQEVNGYRQNIPGGYKLRGANSVSFRVAAYDIRQPLVIDPVVLYSTYLDGGVGNPFTEGSLIMGIALDKTGSAYVTGRTTTADFPTTAGSFQPFFSESAGNEAAFVTKLNASGTGLVYSTYISGSLGEGTQGSSIAVDSSGSAYIAGITGQTDFPTTPGAFQTSLAPDNSTFVTKLTPDGSSLVYSTYLGPTDTFPRIAVDTAGSAYVTGSTESRDFPTTAGAFQPASSGSGFDAFVAKLNRDGSALVYSTYLGGNQDDLASDITVDTLGAAYVAGFTTSSDFPATPGAFQPNFSGGIVEQAFITKLNSSGSALVYSTRLSGSFFGFVNAITVDESGSVYLAGDTLASDFPTTTEAFQTAFAGELDAFVAKLNPSGSALEYSTYLGGSSNQTALDIAVDATGSAYVVIRTTSPDFPTTPGAPQTTLRGMNNLVVAKLNPSGSGLDYSTYLGGSGNDRPRGIAVDAAGSAYVAGGTDSPDFPTTQGAFQPMPPGAENGVTSNAFIAKIAEINTSLLNSVVQPVDLATGAIPVTLTFSGITQPGVTGLITSSTGPNPPSGFQLGNPATFYNLTTTAMFSSVEVCINSSGIIASSQLFHFEAGAWLNVTTSVDTTSHVICGRVTSFSPFAIFTPVFVAVIQPPIAADGSSVFNANRGVVPVKFALTLSGTPTCQMPAATVSVFRKSGNIEVPINQTDFILPSDTGTNFRIDSASCQYIYNLAVKSLGTGVYAVQINIGGDVVGFAVFGLK